MDIIKFLATYGGSIFTGTIAIMLFWINQRITKRRAAKAIGYRVLSRERILSPAATEVGKVKLMAGENRVYVVYLAKMEVVNTGTVSIKPGDFSGPLKIVAPDGSEFLDAELIAHSPAGFNPVITYTPQAVEIAPILLNPGASFTVRILAGRLTRDPAVEAYIDSIDQVRRIFVPANLLWDNLNLYSGWLQRVNVFVLVPVGLFVAFTNRHIPFLLPAVNTLSVASLVLTNLDSWRKRTAAKEWEREHKDVLRISERESQEWRELRAIKDEEYKRDTEEYNRQIENIKRKGAEESAAMRKEHAERTAQAEKERVEHAAQRETESEEALILRQKDGGPS